MTHFAPTETVGNMPEPADSARDTNARPVLRQVGPWQCLSSQVAYENRWIQVRHEEVITPGKTDGIYGVVHFKGTAVGVVPLDAEGQVWLVKQTRYTLNQTSIEIPEGGAPRGENPQDCAHRVLEEEVGLKAGVMRHILTLHLSNSITDERADVFLAECLTPGQIAHEPTEDISLLCVPLKEAVDWAITGRITDAISVAALLRVALLRPEWMV